LEVLSASVTRDRAPRPDPMAGELGPPCYHSGRSGSFGERTGVGWRWIPKGASRVGYKLRNPRWPRVLELIFTTLGSIEPADEEISKK